MFASSGEDNRTRSQFGIIAMSTDKKRFAYILKICN